MNGFCAIGDMAGLFGPGRLGAMNLADCDICGPLTKFGVVRDRSGCCGLAGEPLLAAANA